MLKLNWYKNKIVNTETIYLAFFGIMLTWAFLDTTTIGIVWPERLLRYTKLAMIFFVCAKIAMERPWSLREILLGLMVSGSMCIAYLRAGHPYLLELAVLLVGARNIRGKRILQVYLAVAVSLLLLTMALALAGVIPNLVYYQASHNNKARISFGIIYPTDFAAHVFFIAAAYLWMKDQRANWAAFAVLCGLAVFCYVFCDARNSTGSLLLLALGFLLIRLGEEQGLIKKLSEKKWWDRASLLLCLAMPILAAMMLVLTAVYDPRIAWMKALNDLWMNRLYFGNMAFDRYAVTMFGQSVELIGFGGTTTAPEDYFFLDSSYVNTFFRMGLVVLGVVLLAFVLMALRERERHSWRHVWLLFVVAIVCVMEHHLMELSYDPFLLLLFAEHIDEERLECKKHNTR